MTEAPRHYWLDFNDAQSVLDRIRPDRVAFMNLDGAWVIALNAEARRRDIPTMIIQHGHFNPVRSLPDGRPSHSVSNTLRSGSPILAARFAIRSFGFARAYALARTLLFMAHSRRHGGQRAMLRHRFKERLPDYYVAFSPDGAEVRLQLDAASPDQIACIGLPEYDNLFGRLRAPMATGGSVLLVDSPNAENRWNVTATTIEEKIAFMVALDEAAGSLGRTLRVKLHPESYRAGWLPELPNATYLRDADLVEEFNEAAICVGFDSTLMIPAVWSRPTILVRLRPSRIVDVAAETGAALVLPGMTGVDAELLKTAHELFQQTEEERQAYVHQLAFKPDGRSVERLRAILSEPELGVQRYSLRSSVW